MGGGISSAQLKEYKEANPYLAKYLDCQSRAFFKGVQSSLVGAAAVYIGCYALNKKMPLNPALMIMAPIGGGIVVAYVITRMETKKCQRMWLALEEKHTALTDIASTDISAS